MTRSAGPPEEYLRECSSTSLRYFEMSKLEHVANLRKELTVLLDEMMEESALALFARWMLERRTGPENAAGGGAAKSQTTRRLQRLLADFVASAARTHGPASPGEGLLEGSQEVKGDCEAIGAPLEASGRVLASSAPPLATQEADRRTERRAGRPGRLCDRARDARATVETGR